MNQIEMNVEQYASGIYFVELQSEGLTKSVKLIIE
ncbi:MAG: T9SS type A sorting domain-containing protein [Bacteroidetes bacterium]|nr:T9SS type A sorting domain-containing protein [Bacteroidota bacterium]